MNRDIISLFESLPTYVIEIGVVSGKSKRKQKVKVGITNAELMFIHENGSPIKNIPARPVLKMTIDYASKELIDKSLNKAIDAYLKTNKIEDFEKPLKQMCMRMQNYAREIIYSNDGRLAPNSPRVAAGKGGNHPLFNTGQLARSITCQLIKL